MDPIWIVLADEGRARIFATKEPGADLVEVEELTNAAAHADNADLRRDAYGRRGGGDLGDAGGRRMGGSTTASAGEDKLDHEAELFARRIAKWLQEAQQQGRFRELRLAAAPRFLGRLRGQLDPQLNQSAGRGTRQGSPAGQRARSGAALLPERLSTCHGARALQRLQASFTSPVRAA